MKYRRFTVKKTDIGSYWQRSIHRYLGLLNHAESWSKKALGTVPCSDANDRRGDGNDCRVHQEIRAPFRDFWYVAAHRRASCSAKRRRRPGRARKRISARVWGLRHIVIHIFFRSASFQPEAAISMKFCLKIRQNSGILHQTHRFSGHPSYWRNPMKSPASHWFY